ncbi:hypothetical protein SDC9_148645 [bioreactor metagenome]|uniref:Uncharacterized protein n=1 Tax=bioreactor metagenome TaxID=1076179 RepID=A0A645EJ13_9ZZZZ
MNRLAAITLQILNHLLARQQGLGLFLEALDLSQLLIQNGNFLLEKFISLILSLNFRINQRVNCEHNKNA